jgi:hypothetical protein
VGLVKTNFNPELLAAKLRQLGERSSRRVLGVMREEADTMADLAKQFAPHKDGDLEKAIEVNESRTGWNGRTEITVRVNPNARDNDGDGERVAAYGLRMEHGLAPYGSGAFQLDEGSIAKDGGSGRVGGKFMERAVKARTGVMGKKVKQAVSES